MTGSVLQARGLTRRFAGFTAVDSVDLELQPGRITGLIGPNGAGKSTFINLLSGAFPPSSGSVSLDGTDITNLSVIGRKARGISRSFQKTNIFSDMTVGAQLAVASRATPVKNLDEVADALTLTPFLNALAREISYGDQRRLDLALALIGRPKVLLLDEPAAGLTAQESKVLAETIRALAREWNVTVLLVEHDMEVVFSICDDLAVLHLGKLLRQGDPISIRNDPVVITAYLGSSIDDED
jgi:branched-chain amino acid transport system ATP-binding protein